MAAVDDLTELVERAAAAERSALASKWKAQSDVQALIRRTRAAAEEQRQAVRLDTDPDRLSPRWGALRHKYLDLGAQSALPGQEPLAQVGPDDERDGASRQLSHEAAAQAERDAVAAVGIARIALTDAALAVLQARLARIDAGEDDPDAAAVDGHVPLHGRNPVSRHGPALAHGVTGEIKYILDPQTPGHGEEPGHRPGPGPALPRLDPAVPMGHRPEVAALPGAVGDRRGDGRQGLHQRHELRRDAGPGRPGQRRAALAPAGDQEPGAAVHRRADRVLLCALLAWRAGDIYAFYKACALMVCMILLWLGVGNVLSIVLPSRDEPIRQRKQSGSLKQFIIAFVVSYLIGYLVNAMLVWRVFAAQELTDRLGNALIPAVHHRRSPAPSCGSCSPSSRWPCPSSRRSAG